MSKVFTVDEDVWMPFAWQKPIFNLPSIGLANTTLILAAAIILWIGIAYVLGKFSSTEWILFIAIAGWLSGLSLSIFPDAESQKITLVSVLLPPIIITFVTMYLPEGNKYFSRGFALSLIVFLAYLYYWAKRLFKEFQGYNRILCMKKIPSEGVVTYA